MPQRINGIGTWYVGKRDVDEAVGLCSNCGYYGKLKSYGTRLWFTLVYVPVIPLGKKQILDECPACTSHRAMPADEWERVRTEAVDETAGELSGNPDDPEAALKMFGTLAAFRRHAEAEKFIPILTGKHGDRADVQMAVGGYLEERGRPTEANRHFDKAADLEPENPAALRAAALGRIEEHRPDEAAVLLEPLRPPDGRLAEHFHGGPFFALGKGFAEADEHDRALEQYRLLHEYVPGVAEDKAFKQAVRDSERALSIPKDRSLVNDTPLYRRGWVWATAAILLVAAGLFGFNEWVRRNRPVRVVNGLPRPLTVEVDGETHVVPPLDRVTLTLAEGDHAARVVDPPALADRPAVEFRVGGDWGGRFFDKPVWVVDPSGSGVTLWEDSVYAANPANVRDNRLKLRVAEPFVTYGDIDYPFEEFPEEISVKDNVDSVTKTRVDTLGLPPVMQWALMSGGQVDQVPARDRLDWLEVQLAAAEPSADDANAAPAGPDDMALFFAGPTGDRMLTTAYLGTAMTEGELTRAREFLAAERDRRPDDVDRGRYHQVLALLAGDAADVLADADARLAETPDDPVRLYLRARLAATDDETLDLLDRALAGDGDLSYANTAKAMILAERGETDGALELVEAAAEARPDRFDLADLRTELLFLAGDLETIRTEARAALDAGPDATAVTNLLGTAWVDPDLPDDDARRAKAEALWAEHRPAFEEADPSTKATAFAAATRLTAGPASDPAVLDALPAGVTADRARFRQLAAAGDYAALREAFPPDGLPPAAELAAADPVDLLAVLHAARASGVSDEELARLRSAVLDRLRASEPSDVALADLLAADDPPAAEAVLDLNLVRESTLLALAELAGSTGDADRYRDAAERLNRVPTFPFFLVRDAFAPTP